MIDLDSKEKIDLKGREIKFCPVRGSWQLVPARLLTAADCSVQWLLRCGVGLQVQGGAGAGRCGRARAQAVQVGAGLQGRRASRGQGRTRQPLGSWRGLRRR